jgi:hypothetical protein
MTYDSKFYLSVTERASIAASLAASITSKFLKPSSLVDIGSGQGIWSQSFSEAMPSLRYIYAIDLESDNISLLESHTKSGIPTVAKVSQDLSRNQSLPDKVFDIGICVEVLEHLPKIAAELLMLEFGKKCKFLVFSAAITGQGGTHHINEQNLNYWSNKLAATGFVPLDVFRKEFREDARIPSYYSNSIALWVNVGYVDNVNIGILNLNQLFKCFSPDISDSRSFLNKLRYFIVGLLPHQTVTLIAKVKNSQIRSR